MIPIDRCVSTAIPLPTVSLNIRLITSWQVLDARSFKGAGSDINHRVKSKGNFTLEQAIKAQKGNSGIAVLFLYFGARWGWVVKTTPRPLYPRQSDPVPIVQEAGWRPGPVWTGAEHLATTGIRSLDRPARNESLYRIRYRMVVKVGKRLGKRISRTKLWNGVIQCQEPKRDVS
jgi:hypothetical protein